MNKITILVALYKAGEFIKSKLESLRSLSNFNECNIVLLNCQNIDNESSSYRSFLGFKNVREIYYNNHVSLYKTWNDGITSSESEFIMNSNVDDIIHPDYVVRGCGFLDDHQEYGVSSSGVLVTNIPNQLWPNWNYISEMPNLAYPYSTAGPCPIWRRSLHFYGYFDDRYMTIGDARMWELWYRNGVEFGVYQDKLVLYYINPDSLERRSIDGVKLRDYDMEIK